MIASMLDRRVVIPALCSALLAGFIIYSRETLTLTRSHAIEGPGIVTLAFDDGWESAYTYAFPALEAAGVKATWYVLTGPWSDPYDPNYMSPDQVMEIYKAGHEIGAHTRTHPHLPELPLADAQADMENAKHDLEAKGMLVRTMSYPYGEYNDAVARLAQDAGFSAARTMWRGFNSTSTDPFILKSQQVERATTPEEVRVWIDEARANDAWLILTFHEIEDSHSTDRPYAVTPKQFEEILQIVLESRIPVVTVQEGVDMLQRSKSDK